MKLTWKYRIKKTNPSSICRAEIVISLDEIFEGKVVYNEDNRAESCQASPAGRSHIAYEFSTGTLTDQTDLDFFIIMEWPDTMKL